MYSLFTKKKKIKLPRMPPKRFFDHGPEVVQERVLGLGEVLAEMIEVAHDDQDLKDFLAPLDSSFPQSLEEQVDGRLLGRDHVRRGER